MVIHESSMVLFLPCLLLFFGGGGGGGGCESVRSVV